MSSPAPDASDSDRGLREASIAMAASSLSAASLSAEPVSDSATASSPVPASDAAERVMVSVESILAIHPIDKSDNLQLAMVLGWQVVVRIDDHFAVGDRVLFYRIDAILPKECPHYAFLEGKPLRSRKICGTLSQGLVGKLEWATWHGVGDPATELAVGQDCTERFGITKREDDDSADGAAGGANGGGAKTVLPWGIPKTKENRVQDVPRRLQSMVGKPVLWTRKEDGCSVTFAFNRGEFKLCGRTREITKDLEKESGCYLEAARKTDIAAKLASLALNIAIRGEVVGPKINGNNLKLNAIEVRVFKIWDIDGGFYWAHRRTKKMCDTLQLDMVPVEFRGLCTEEMATVPWLLAAAKKITYGAGILGEGFVMQTDDDEMQPMTVSFKVLSNDYILKHGR